MNRRRQRRLLTAGVLLAGSGLVVALVLYALRSGIDLFYTPGEMVYGKRETHQRPVVGERLRVGGIVMPGSVTHVPGSLQVAFSVCDRAGVIRIRYNGLLPDLFREGQSVVVQGVLQDPRQVQAEEVLARHDENYIPRKVEKAMREIPRQSPVFACSTGGHDAP